MEARAERRAATPALRERFERYQSELKLSEDEADLLTAQLQRAADLDYIVTGIIGAVFFALLFSTAALMMQAIRERRPELAVLKTVGFSDRKVMMLILAEAPSPLQLVGVLCIVAGLLLATVRRRESLRALEPEIG